MVVVVIGFRYRGLVGCYLTVACRFHALAQRVQAALQYLFLPKTAIVSQGSLTDIFKNTPASAPCPTFSVVIDTSVPNRPPTMCIRPYWKATFFRHDMSTRRVPGGPFELSPPWVTQRPRNRQENSEREPVLEPKFVEGGVEKRV